MDISFVFMNPDSGNTGHNMSTGGGSNSGGGPNPGGGSDTNLVANPHPGGSNSDEQSNFPNIPASSQPNPNILASSQPNPIGPQSDYFSLIINPPIIHLRQGGGVGAYDTATVGGQCADYLQGHIGRTLTQAGIR